GARTHGVCAEEQLAGRPRQCERLPVRCARVVEEDELRGHAFLPSSWTSRSGSCASARFMSGASARGATNVTPFACTTTRSRAPNTTTSPSSDHRSEERRVGKECRSRGWPKLKEKQRNG